ncbi:ECF transporter S component [Clostridium sp. SHJSY1]|uniref:ECF transporter S component n=1 Tax=Clostridium sp. SHJSY1 TaxID=2942483 RepID=UPI002875AD89|nr:ECF transporter S component [Clostridium sp. SHJSY1]MDS0526620.1 ECF transporter S component [Clostridium sp. SHJSY1]
MNNTSTNLSKTIKISLLAAISVILMFFEFPILPLFPWLKIDMSELPVLMGAFAFGPIVGIIVEGLKIVLFFIVRGTQSFGVGEVANFIIGISFVVPASIIYNRNRNKKTAIIGMMVGTLFMEVFAIVANIYFLLPAYGMAMDSAQLMNYVVAGLLPFNGIKAVLVSIVTFVVYKRVSETIFKAEMKTRETKEISR